MKKFPFTRQTDESLILVKVLVNASALYLALDTGATHTVIDTTALLLAGCSPIQSETATQLETASGIVNAEMFEVNILESLGIRRNKFPVHSYDLIGNGVLVEIDGVLGLDFFKNHKFCIDLDLHEVSISVSLEGRI
jgi:hypothetical protein